MTEFTRGILVKTDGIYYRDWDDGEQLEEKVDSFIPYLNEEIRVEDDVTFEDFFNHVMDAYEIINLVFASQLGHFDLNNWREEWSKPFMDKPDGHTKTKYLEVGWCAELWDTDIYPDGREIEEWVGFGGRGDTFDEETGEWISDMGISFSFSPINEMKNYPFKIKTNYKMFDWAKYKANKETDNHDDQYVVDGNKKMTVYNVIGAVLDDISFYGRPSQRDEISAELQSQVDDIKKEIDEHSGVDGAVDAGILKEWEFDDDE